MPSTPATQARSTRWSLEVVRGRDAGKVFALSGGEAVLGNRLEGAGGLDLSEQEADSPRRMAARQAAIEVRGTDLVIRDLDSPGGTFVNRQRLLAGQERRLQAGDEIQLGGVLLRVAAGGTDPPAAGPARPAAPPLSAAPGRLAVPYSIDGAVACRTWDDFLVVAAQRWRDLRAELESGRLADYLRRVQRADLLPEESAGRSATTSGGRERAVGPPPGPPPLPDGRGSVSDADERLDRWLARLPASQSSAPELDVHPASVEVRPGGGTTRHVLKVANVGCRLLRGTARVEPADGWVRLLPPFDGRPFVTVEGTEIAVEVTVPEDSPGPIAAEVVIESNGGARRIPFRLGRPQRPPAMPDAVESPSGPPIWELLEAVANRLRRVAPPVRFAAAVAAALAFRALVLVPAAIPLGPPATRMTEPRLPALAAACAGLGVVLGAVRGWRRRDTGPAEAVASGLASGMLGSLAAAVLHAVIRTVERPLGDWSASIWALTMAWALVGCALAGLSCLVVPYRQGTGGPSR